MAEKKEIPIEILCEINLKVFRSILEKIIIDVAEQPEDALETHPRGIRYNKPKNALIIDVDAQRQYKSQLNKELTKKHFSKITIYGEEDFERESPDLSSVKGIAGLVDMLDGSDLLERGLSNWCSAACFFKPSAESGNKILGAFVGMPNGEVYYSTIENEKDVFVRPYKKEDENLPHLDTIEKHFLRETLENASICFYGQKVSSLRKTINATPNLWDHLGKLEENRNSVITEKKARGEKLNNEDTKIDFRIYNLNGIPMVIRLIDYRIKVNRKIDIVFNITGQSPHDVVPGLYLAMKLGAIVINLTNHKKMKLEDLEESLMRPAENKLYYAVISNQVLANEVLPLLPQIDKTSS